MKSKKSIILGITSLVLVTLLLLGLTYAYYRTRIIGNNSIEPSISVVSKVLEIAYKDGESTLNMEGLIEPGFVWTKTFSVENTGTEPVTYNVYMEDVVNDFVRYEDWKYEITCSPDCNGTTVPTVFPRLSEKLLENTVPAGVTQTYNLTLRYAKLDHIDQSADMRKKLEGTIQIYTPEDVVDIEGTIATYNEGDYVQINSIEKKSQIINGKYKLPAVEVGNHTLRVMSEEGQEIGKTGLTIEKGEREIDGNTLSIDNNSQAVTINITNLSSDLGVEIEEIKDYSVQTGTLVYKLFNDDRIKQNDEVFTEISNSSTTEDGLFKTEDDYGTTWYFRGAQSYNYVKFAGFIWRIVRVNGDGSIRLILDGTMDNVTREGETSVIGAKSVYNSKKSNAGAGYMYGFDSVTNNVCLKTVNGVTELGVETTESDCLTNKGTWTSAYDATHMNLNDSTVKTVLDNFYEKYIKNYESLIADSLFCGEKTIGTRHYDSTEIVGDGYSNILTYYRAYTRLFTYKQLAPNYVYPTLECDKGTANNYSRYTSKYNVETKTSKGVEINNVLKYPIALLSADELIFAGAYKGEVNTSYYLHNDNLSNYWWTMTPASYMKGSPIGFPMMFVSTITEDYYSINRLRGTSACGVRPVINLKNSVVIVSGKGTQSNPYIIG